MCAVACLGIRFGLVFGCTHAQSGPDEVGDAATADTRRLRECVALQHKYAPCCLMLSWSWAGVVSSACGSSCQGGKARVAHAEGPTHATCCCISGCATKGLRLCKLAWSWSSQRVWCFFRLLRHGMCMALCGRCWVAHTMLYNAEGICCCIHHSEILWATCSDGV